MLFDSESASSFLPLRILTAIHQMADGIICTRLNRDRGITAFRLRRKTVNVCLYSLKTCSHAKGFLWDKYISTNDTDSITFISVSFLERSGRLAKTIARGFVNDFSKFTRPLRTSLAFI
jgi:hypothetical protein